MAKSKKAVEKDEITTTEKTISAEETTAALTEAELKAKVKEEGLKKDMEYFKRVMADVKDLTFESKPTDILIAGNNLVTFAKYKMSK